MQRGRGDESGPACTGELKGNCLSPTRLLRRVATANEPLGRAAAQAMLVETAGAFTGAVEAGDDLAVHIEDLAFGVDAQA